jgi:hypothetical protein
MLILIRACHQMGVMLAARKYDFEADSPFQLCDILDLQSVVKHLSPVCVDARDLLESGKLRLAQVRFKNLGSIFCLFFDSYSRRYAFVLISHKSSFVEGVREVGGRFSGFLAMGSEEVPWTVLAHFSKRRRTVFVVLIRVSLILLFRGS